MGGVVPSAATLTRRLKKKKKGRRVSECELVRKEMFSSQRSVCVRRVSLLPAQPSRLCAPLGGVAARHPAVDPDIANAQHLSLWQCGAPQLATRAPFSTSDSSSSSSFSSPLKTSSLIPHSCLTSSQESRLELVACKQQTT